MDVMHGDGSRLVVVVFNGGVLYLTVDFYRLMMTSRKVLLLGGATKDDGKL